MNIYDDFLERLDRASVQYGNKYQLSKKIGVAPSLITRWVKRERVPGLDSIQPFADLVGLFLADKNDISNTVVSKECEELRKENYDLKVAVKVLHEALRQMRSDPTPQTPSAGGDSSKHQKLYTLTGTGGDI